MAERSDRSSKFLVLAERGKTKSVAERIETLKKYRARYLKDEGSEQAYALFALLELIAKNFNHLDTALRDASEQIQQFRTMNVPMMDGIQILSYVYYWDRFIAGLRAHKKNSPLGM